MGRKAPALLRRVLSEPLVHFVVLGLALFALGQAYQVKNDVYRIVVTPAHVAQLSRSYALQYGEAPSPDLLEQLIRDDINDEMLFRQGLALKLDQNDEIVRRRIVQKEQFLLQNLNAPAEPTEAELAAYYAAHRGRYLVPSRASFSHIFFGVGSGDDVQAKAGALAVLARVPPGVTRAPQLGDPFPDLYDFSAFDQQQVERLFGHTDFASAVFTAPPGRWVGPFRSAYGWHLLRVTTRDAPIQPSLTEVRDRVRTDYFQDMQDKANIAAFGRLSRRFTVVRADRGTRP